MRPLPPSPGVSPRCPSSALLLFLHAASYSFCMRRALTPHAEQTCRSSLASQLDSEKRLRRQWKAHDAQKQVFDPSSGEMGQLVALSAKLDDLCAEPSRTGKSEEKVPPSKRSQLKKLRDEMRATLANVDRKLAEPDDALTDPQELKAREQAMEAMKLPPHLRGSRVLRETMGGGDS